MTLPDERLRALCYTKAFLIALINPKQTPKVPLEIRRWARSCLKHYPSELDMSRAEKDFKKVFGKIEAYLKSARCRLGEK